MSIAQTAGRDVRQLVVLGAGLDTYACRGALRDRQRVFEVDSGHRWLWLFFETIQHLPDLRVRPDAQRRFEMPDGLRRSAGYPR